MEHISTNNQKCGGTYKYCPVYHGMVCSKCGHQSKLFTDQNKFRGDSGGRQ